jgi:hypothetical protein
MLPRPRESETVAPDAATSADEAPILRAALDRAWEFLAPKRRTDANREALAAVIARLAARGERDPGQLSIRALRAILPEAPLEAL